MISWPMLCLRCISHPLKRHVSSMKRRHIAADRNSLPISQAIRTQLDLETPNLQLLEIASGCGQHAGFLAPLFKNITFHPTEYERYNFASISAYAADCPTKNIREPVYVDISQKPEEWEEAPFKLDSFDYMFNANMMHITMWECTEGLFHSAGKLLKPKGMLFTYGPYAVHGVLTPESNVNFDMVLKMENSEYGVRDIVELKQLAEANGLVLQQTQEMPSNNKFLTWLKN